MRRVAPAGLQMMIYFFILPSAVFTECSASSHPVSYHGLNLWKGAPFTPARLSSANLNHAAGLNAACCLKREILQPLSSAALHQSGARLYASFFSFPTDGAPIVSAV